ncbi:VWA domain-containing protein [Leuconostoc koreense]|nr:VWA domain-containing protein [Leuconostoc mesenteroides]QGM24543.1 VWA domain-containing protein [Leuconostoc mesenteroides subsp. mesenteroides]
MKINIHKLVNSPFVRCFSVFLILSTLIANALIVPLTTVSAASDITPQYTDNDMGVFPVNSWTIPRQNDVINHQGGNVLNGWDKTNTWNGDSNNTTNSYLKFGMDNNNPDYQIRKYAKETSTPGLYDVYLNAKGNEVNNVKPVDIVLVVDMSGSMNPQSNGGTNRVQAVKDGVNNFLTQINSSGLGEYVRVGVVGFSSPTFIGGSNGFVSQEIGSVNNGQISAINNLLNQRFQGGTFTQAGIRRAQQMLSSDTSNSKKMMIVMTDGVPTFSNRVTNSIVSNNTIFGTSFSNTRDEPGNTSSLLRNNKRYVDGRYTDSSGNRINDTWAATLGEARLAQLTGSQIHALGIQLGNDYNNVTNPFYLSQAQVRSRMQLIASSPDLYQDANNSSDVETYLNNQAKNVLSQFNTVNQGSISDPLGTQFIYGDDTPTVRSVGRSAVHNLPTVTKSNGSISVSNINLGKDQEIQIHYQAHLNTESDSFKPDYWYQMNGKTIFTPTKDAHAVEFGVPSAKAPGTELKVTKQWQELTDSSKRPDSINFEVTRTTNNQSNDWRATGTLSQSDNWSKTFKQLNRNNQSVSLPAYDNKGGTFNYQVLNESTDGYVSNITNKINESTITNTQYGLIIDKYASNSKNKLTGAEFIVKSTDGKQSYTLKDNQLQQLTPGDYTIQETKSPSGYQLDATVYPVTLSQDGKWSSSGQDINVKSPTSDSDGYKDGFSIATEQSNNTDKNNVVRFVKNDTFKKFDLTVNKADKATGNALKGAKFSLTDANGKTSSYKETDPTAIFTFENLSSGTYTLKELKAPDGYITSQDVTIIISDDGSVKVTHNNGDWKSTLQNDAGNNQISLTVNNSNKTVFPSTGGTGIVRYMLIAGTFILIALGASSYYLFRIKRGNRS